MNLMLWKRLSSHWLFTLALAGAILVAAPTRAEIIPYEAVYRVEYKGAHIADATFKLSRDRGRRYVFVSNTRPRGLAKLFRRERPSEESVFEFSDGQVTPLSYRFKDGTRKGKGNSEVSFDWDRKLATSVYEQETMALALQEPVLDRITLQLQVMHDLQEGTEPSSYLLAYRNQLRRYGYTNEGETRIETQAGDFDTLRFAQQREGSSRRTLLWMAPELGFLPVHMEQQRRGKTELTFSLIDVSGSLATKPAGE